MPFWYIVYAYPRFPNKNHSAISSVETNSFCIRNPYGQEVGIYDLKPATDNSQDVCEMKKTCEMRNVCTGYFVFLKLAIDNLWGVREMKKTGEIREKKGYARDNVKIIYRLFAIRLFSLAIILSLIAWENPFVSRIITPSSSRWFETKQHKKYKITGTHGSHLACFSYLGLYAASWDRFLVSCVSNHLAVEAIIMYKTKGFSRAIRDKIITRKCNSL